MKSRRAQLWSLAVLAALLLTSWLGYSMFRPREVAGMNVGGPMSGCQCTKRLDR